MTFTVGLKSPHIWAGGHLHALPVGSKPSPP